MKFEAQEKCTGIGVPTLQEFQIGDTRVPNGKPLGTDRFNSPIHKHEPSNVKAELDGVALDERRRDGHLAANPAVALTVKSLPDQSRYSHRAA
jgi:hypothetical protein